MTLKKRSFENIAGKGENAGKQHFLLFPKYFFPFQRQISVFKSLILSANAFNLDRSEILSFGKELKCRLQFVPIWTSLKFCHLVMSLLAFVFSSSCFLSIVKQVKVSMSSKYILMAVENSLEKNQMLVTWNTSFFSHSVFPNI